MRRFRLTGPEVLIGGSSFQNFSNTVAIRDGQIGVLADDDPRCDDLARSPYLEEVDENGNVVVAPAVVVDSESRPDSSDEVGDAAGAPVEDEEPTKTRGRKGHADSGGV